MPPPVPGVALALGGGAALGWAHIGVIRALAARQVPIVAAAGTSIGALVAVCLAGGKLDALEEIARTATFWRTLRYLDLRFRGGVLGGRPIMAELKTHFADARLEELSMPCAAVAADLITGAALTITEGPVIEAVMASVAIPGVFRPVARCGALLADGGLISPVPVAAARQISSAPVLAVNLTGDYVRRAAAAGLSADSNPQTLSAMRITRASIGLLLATLAQRELALEPADVTLSPRIGHIDVADFTKADALIAAGEAAVLAQWDAIARCTGLGA